MTPFEVAITINAQREVIAPAKQAGLSFLSWPESPTATLTFTAGPPAAVLIATYASLAWLPMVGR